MGVRLERVHRAGSALRLEGAGNGTSDSLREVPASLLHDSTLLRTLNHAAGVLPLRRAPVLLFSYQYYKQQNFLMCPLSHPLRKTPYKKVCSFSSACA